MDELHVKFRSQISRAEIDNFNSRFGTEIIKNNEFNEYLLRLTESSPYNALEIANKYYESGLTEWSIPNFLADLKRRQVNDQYFYKQWYLRNSCQEGQYSTYGVDIDAVRAWDITMGNSSVTVAVIDDGVEMHEDFSAGQVLPGYNPFTEGTGEPLSNTEDKHGQCVAGLIAANANSVGVRGVAPDVKIMPVHIFSDGVTIQQRAAGIDWAWQNGADILNLSWGAQGVCGDPYPDIDAAITRAITNGRGGKGCLVVVSAGNGGLSCVEWPANVPGVLAVGAVSVENQRSTYSPLSTSIDLVAPSSTTLSYPPNIYYQCEYQENIYTMDRYNAATYTGYNPCFTHEPTNLVVTGDLTGKYFESFGGTSASAPLVSGIGALLLSVNPNLEARSVGANPNPQVQTIIKQSADDYGNTDWDGAGRANAYRAVLNAASSTINYQMEEWNIASVPVVVANWDVTSLWPNALTPVTTYQGGAYVTVSSAQSGRGYWIKYPLQSVSYAGTGLYPTSVAVTQDWNMIGSVNKEINLNEIQSPEGVAILSCFEYSSGYVAVSTLEPGKGYWMKVDKNGTLLLNFLPNDKQPTIAPTLVQPANNTFALPLAITFRWNAACSADSYELQIATDDQFTNLFYDNSALTGTTTYLTGFSYNTTYYWRMNSYNNNGRGSWSNTYVFSTAVGSGPTLISPYDGQQNVSFFAPQLTWNSMGGALSYHVRVETFSGWGIFDYPSVTATSIVTGQLEDMTTYYWKVRALVAAGYTDWSSRWSFTTGIVQGVDPCVSTASLESMDVITVSDANSNKQTLYLYNGERNLNKKKIKDDELPPEPPGNIFDVRFEGNKYIKSIHAKDGLKTVAIKVKGATPPLSISWNVRQVNKTQYWLMDPNHERRSLKGNGSIGVGTLTNGSIVLQTSSVSPCELEKTGTFNNNANGNESQPSRYVLEQNVPNPFNPMTIINYQLPADGKVELQVFNTLGQVVATLVNEYQSAGSKSARFSATNLPSGVYYYRLQAGTFSDVKKMVLVR